MNDKPTVSIIAPVYKVEQYLPKMVESVLAQSFSDYELWLVDDGSPDGSGKLCDEIALRDERIKVIHKKNGGSASARNMAIEQARGKYFYFMDSDDWIEKDMLQLLVNAAEKYHCMLTITGFCMEYFLNGKTILYDVCPEQAIYETALEFRKEAYKYFYRNLLNVPWNKLYLAKPILEKHIRFPEDYRQWNDVPFNLEYMKDVDSVAVIPGTMYHYICSRPGAEGSVIATSSYGYELRKKQFSGILELYKYWDIQDEISMGEIYAYHASRLLKTVFEISVMPGLSTEERRNRVSGVIHDAQTRESFMRARFKNPLMRIAALPVKWGAVSLSLFEGRVFNFVKTHMSDRFYRLQSSVVNKAEKRIGGGGTEELTYSFTGFFRLSCTQAVCAAEGAVA